MTVAVLTLGGCSFGSGARREGGQLDCTPIREARRTDRVAGALLGAVTLGLIVAGVASQEDDDPDRKGQGNFAPVIFTSLGVLFAVPATFYGVSAATGTDKLTQCDRRRRKEALPAAGGLPRAPHD